MRDDRPMSADVDVDGIDMGPDEFAGDDGARFKPADVDAAREALRRYFMDHGWVIQMDDREGQTLDPFDLLAEREDAIRAEYEAKLAALREAAEAVANESPRNRAFIEKWQRLRAALAATPAEVPEPFHICPACGTGHNLEGDPAYAATPAEEER